MKFPAVPVRGRVAGMLFVAVAINYLDRSNLSIAAVDLAGELHLDRVQMGYIFGGFGWSYALCQIPGGWLVDRIRPRTLYAAACGLWSLATLAQGWVSGFLALLGLRLVLGMLEAPTFPICNQLVTRWFPERERAGAVGFYTAGQYVGLGLFTGVLTYTQHALGWRWVFFLTGGAGLLWAGAWRRFYRDPAESPRLTAAERETIRAGGGWVDGAPRPAGPARRFNWGDLRLVLTQRPLWGLYVGQFCLNAIPWFFLTWFPTYLVKERHFDFIHAGWMTSLPFLAAFAGVLSGGFCSDWMVRRGFSATVARKTPIVAGMLLSTCVVGANFVQAPGWVVFFLALAFFGNGFASITWTLISLMAPQRLLGLTGGVFNFIGNGAAISVPIVIGFIADRAGFAPALALVSAVALGGALSYLFVVGPVRRVTG